MVWSALSPGISGHNIDEHLFGSGTARVCLVCDSNVSRVLSYPVRYDTAMAPSHCLSLHYSWWLNPEGALSASLVPCVTKQQNIWTRRTDSQQYGALCRCEFKQSVDLSMNLAERSSLYWSVIWYTKSISFPILYKYELYLEHIEAWTKWPTFCRRHFEELLYFDLKSIDFPFETNWQKYSTGLRHNGLAPTRRKEITWTNGDQDLWPLMASLDRDDRLSFP